MVKIIYGVLHVHGKRIREYMVLEPVKCELCGEVFQPQTQTTKYCSKKCGNKAWYEANKERIYKNKKEEYAKNSEQVSADRKARYWKDPEKWRTKSREYAKAHRKEKKESDLSYKDKIRHDFKRSELISKNGLICSACGLKGDSFNIIAHHVTLNPNEHEQQELLCRSCHAKLHELGKEREKHISKEAIIHALDKCGNVEDAAKLLGISRSYLYLNRKKYNLPKRRTT